MRKFVILGFCLFCLGLLSLIPYSGGSPGAKTGSPTDGENCTQCHGGSAIQVSGWVTTTIPETGYLPGETYSLSIKGTHPGVSRFGFELTSEDNSGAKSGLFIVTNTSQNKLANNNKSITHKSGGTSPSGNSKTWDCEWTAPDEGTGDVTFYAAFNAANGNNQTSGDVIYKTSLLIPENTSSGIDLQDKEEQIFSVFQPELNTLMIKYSEENSPEVYIKIFNMSGQTIISKKDIIIGDNPISLDISHLKSNLYFVQIETPEKLMTKKIMIRK